MLEFHRGYAADQSGVRVAARDGGRRILFRVEKSIAIKELGLHPGRRFDDLLQEHLPTSAKRADVPIAPSKIWII